LLACAKVFSGLELYPFIRFKTRLRFKPPLFAGIHWKIPSENVFEIKLAPSVGAQRHQNQIQMVFYFRM